MATTTSNPPLNDLNQLPTFFPPKNPLPFDNHTLREDINDDDTVSVDMKLNNISTSYSIVTWHSSPPSQKLKAHELLSNTHRKFSQNASDSLTFKVQATQIHKQKKRTSNFDYAKLFCFCLSYHFLVYWNVRDLMITGRNRDCKRLIRNKILDFICRLETKLNPSSLTNYLKTTLPFFLLKTIIIISPPVLETILIT